MEVWYGSAPQVLHLGPEDSPEGAQQQLLLLANCLLVNQLLVCAQEEGDLGLPPASRVHEHEQKLLNPKIYSE